MDAAEYKHVVLGLIFLVLRYISDAFEELHARLGSERSQGQGADPEDPDEYREADRRGENLGLTEDEMAFYDALGTNDSTVEVMGDRQLCLIARELLSAVRENVTIDWSIRETVRAHMRVVIKRILRRRGYPPDRQAKAAELVLEQAEALCRDWGDDEKPQS
jgi:type I restriction-modification system DNA methylase subunit